MTLIGNRHIVTGTRILTTVNTMKAFCANIPDLPYTNNKP